MSVRQKLSAATLLSLLLTCGTGVASDFIVEIGGTDGTPFGGTCLLVTGNSYVKHEAIGTTPLTLELSADVISCAIQRRGGSGDLRISIKDTSGRLVATSAGVQPFGVIMAAGR
jgi:hypothetical protein